MKSEVESIVVWIVVLSTYALNNKLRMPWITKVLKHLKELQLLTKYLEQSKEIQQNQKKLQEFDILNAKTGHVSTQY